MVYGYARCSTDETKQDIDRQIVEINQKGIEREHIYFEYESGTKSDRPELKKLLKVIKNGDTIIATEVSRITRSTQQLCEIIELAKEKSIKLEFGTFIFDCTKDFDPMMEGMLKMMGVFAEIERNIISQRVKSGIKNAKAKGKILGRPKSNKENIPISFYKYYPDYKNGKRYGYCFSAGSDYMLEKNIDLEIRISYNSLNQFNRRNGEEVLNTIGASLNAYYRIF
jgi:DNA invertase Pin-like site-specific DNA recombinase